MKLFEYGLVEKIRSAVGSEAQITFTDNRYRFLSVQNKNGQMKIRLARFFVVAGKELHDHLLGYIAGQEKKLDQSVYRYAESVAVEKKRQVKLPVGKSAGKVYDLNQTLKNVCRFHGMDVKNMAIRWGRMGRSPLLGKKLRRRKQGSIRLGSCDTERRIITIHPVLDNPVVPKEYLEFIVYHELLHLVIEVEYSKSGRRKDHGKKFRQAEKQFYRYDLARSFETDGIRELMKMRDLA
jgi:hypothetical protein